MNKLRNILIIATCILVLIVVFFYMDYSDLSWSNNRGSYMGIINGIVIIIINIVANRIDMKRQNAYGKGFDKNNLTQKKGKTHKAIRVGIIQSVKGADIK